MGWRENIKLLREIQDLEAAWFTPKGNIE